MIGKLYNTRIAPRNPSVGTHYYNNRGNLYRYDGGMWTPIAGGDVAAMIVARGDWDEVIYDQPQSGYGDF